MTVPGAGRPVASVDRRPESPGSHSDRVASTRPSSCPITDCGRCPRSAGAPPVDGPGGATASIDYEPSESTTTLFGGNSNWRGPVWFPPNYLLIEALSRYHSYFGDGLRLEHPTGGGRIATLDGVADDLRQRLIGIFLPGRDGRRPVFGDIERMQTDPRWHDQMFFHEYFHGDTGAGLGASHQTGWTGLVLDLVAEPRTGDPAAPHEPPEPGGPARPGNAYSRGR